MKVCVIGDSHVRNMSPYLSVIDPFGSNFILSKGSNNQAVTHLYRSKTTAVQTYDPDLCIIHMGHNSLAYHSSKNPSPTTSRLATADTLNLATVLITDLPETRVAISTVLPRTPTPASLLNEDMIRMYNRVAKRHGQRLRTEATRLNFRVSLLNPFWRSISRAEADPSFYSPDGLHLNDLGMRTLVQTWATDIMFPQQ